MAPRYDVMFGRIAMPTLTDEFVENLGRTMDTVGEAVIPGARSPVTATLTLPIHGDEGEATPWVQGDRIRRQLRSLLNNPVATQQIYLQCSVDTELNGFIACGQGSISYNPGGPTFGEYQLQLQDCYKLGTLRSHRMAKEVRVFDRTLIQTPRDYRKTYFAEDGTTPISQVYFPIGATDIATEYKTQGIGTVATLNGNIPFANNMVNGDGVSFEIAEADLLKSDVVIWDRRGNTSPTYTTAGDRDPQSETAGYGWEEVYGPLYPLTVGDVPVMGNAKSRVRWTGGSSFVVEQSTGSAYGSSVTVSCGYTTLRGSRVVEWTPDCGIIACDFTTSGGNENRGTVYITLRRGWPGPLIETYGFNWFGYTAPTMSGPGAADSGNGWAARMVNAAQAVYLADSRTYSALVSR